MACSRVFVLSSLTAALPALALLLTPAPTHACGGTFCDNLPQPMPVDQRGEDILFIRDGADVEVHVRIQYTGEAERFAWIVPLQAVPEVAVSSDPLFTALSNATVPRWSTRTEFECSEDEPEPSPKFDLGGNPDMGGGDGGPEIVLEETVGAFEIVVLQGGTAAELTDFLSANDYAQDPDAEPIVQEYLDEGFLFAAVKLTAGADVSEIHPLSFSFPGTEPCVPLRLTAIAAEENMPVRAYFLGEERWAPSNYAHVVLNPLAFNWSNPTTARYLQLFDAAVDEADGQGFVTEYAGQSASVATNSIYNPSWDESAFIGVDPIIAIDLIAAQQLNLHPLIRSLLLEYIPPPDGLEAQDYWNFIEDFQDQIDLDAWDDEAFAADLLERIIEPGLHAVELLETWPTLTRLHTRISPQEMTLDPTFHPVPDLPTGFTGDVETTRRILCGAVEQVYDVELDGETYPVCVPENGAYPDDWEMPAALRIEQIPMMGPPQVETDNSELIDSVYASYDEGVTCMDDDGVADTGTGEGGDPTTTSGGNSSSGGGGDESTETGPSYDLPYDTSCGCSTPSGQAPLGVALGLLVLGLIGPWRRRD